MRKGSGGIVKVSFELWKDLASIEKESCRDRRWLWPGLRKSLEEMEEGPAEMEEGV